MQVFSVVLVGQFHPRPPVALPFVVLGMTLGALACLASALLSMLHLSSLFT